MSEDYKQQNYPTKKVVVVPQYPMGEGVSDVVRTTTENYPFFDVAPNSINFLSTRLYDNIRNKSMGFCNRYFDLFFFYQTKGHKLIRHFFTCKSIKVFLLQPPGQALPGPLLLKRSFEISSIFSFFTCKIFLTFSAEQQIALT